MSKLPERLKKLREENNITQSELAEELGFKNYTTITKWESGTNLPRGKELKLLAELFGVSSDYILGLSDVRKHNTTTDINKIYNQLTPPRQQKVYQFAEHQLSEQQKVVNMEDYITENLIGYVSAGTGEYLAEEINEEVHLPKDIVPEQRYDMVLRVNGDSMEPMFQDGEFIFVRKDEHFRSGQIGVFIIDGESYLKKAYIEDNHIRLVSLNKNYENLIFKDGSRIELIGTVVM